MIGGNVCRAGIACLAVFAISFNQSNAGCQNGDPMLISHASAYRSEAEETQLWQEIGTIGENVLREKVRDAFSGRICVDDDDLLTVLQSMANSSNEAVRAETVLVLQHFEIQKVSTTVRKALNDHSPRVRLMALGAVVNLCDEGAADLIATLRHEDPVRAVRKEAKIVSKIFKKGCTRLFELNKGDVLDQRN